MSSWSTAVAYYSPFESIVEGEKKMDGDVCDAMLGHSRRGRLFKNKTKKSWTRGQLAGGRHERCCFQEMPYDEAVRHVSTGAAGLLLVLEVIYELTTALLYELASASTLMVE
jgi:hypothetical protein